MINKQDAKKLTTLAAALGLAIGLAPAANAGYLTDSAGRVVTNNYGECWNAKGGMDKKVEACGDVMPVEKEKDSDGDGVVDSKDACPGTPAGVKVDAKGCPLDTDGDGVLDYMDKCPNSRPGAKVNSDGCEIIENVVINSVQANFAFDSADLSADMKAALDEVAAKLAATPGNEQIEIVGHTDSKGAEGYNQRLSERRAQSAADYLISKGVDAASVAVSGMGESSPVADNATEAGRAQNRRVVIKAQ